MNKNFSPDFSNEREFYQEDSLVIGLDEVGRGPLAGPMVIGGCAFISLDKDFEEELIQNKVKDSKKFSSHSLREKVSNYIMNMDGVKCFTDFVRVDADVINQYMIENISFNLIQREIHEICANRLKEKIEKAGYNVSKIIIDGELPLISQENNNMLKCLPDGDKLSLTVAAASIIAKVHHDRIMILMDKKYPEYDFINNKGYGSQKHRDAINKYGYCPEHRVKFGCVKGKKMNMKHFNNF